MKKTLIHWLVWISFIVPAFGGASAQDSPAWDFGKSGPHAVGFKLVEFKDSSRTYFGPAGSGTGPVRPEFRSIRMWLWYPAEPGSSARLPFESFVRLAAGDFEGQPVNGPRNLSLPVPLAEGWSRNGLEALLRKTTLSRADAAPLPGRHPLVLVETGLFYESPLTFLALSEFLASRGYIVAACPLRGSQNRLTVLNISDLEAAVRDLEAVLAKVLEMPNVDPERVGLIGFDMGGMAAIILAMRNPIVRAFVSIDCSIISPHYSGLPASHPAYDLRKLVIPWIHFTPSGSFKPGLKKHNPPTVMDRKEYGDDYFVLTKTTLHGATTTYSWLGIENPVPGPGYWDTLEPNMKDLARSFYKCSLMFLDGYLQNDASSRSRLQNLARNNEYPEAFSSFEFAAGPPAPRSQDEWISRIIHNGMAATLPDLEKFRAEYPADKLFDEKILNWLGIHFLYWWGREEEAVALFEWVTRVYPKSGDAYDSLGEACLTVGKRDKAIECYRRALELNPGNANAKAALEKLTKK